VPNLKIRELSVLCEIILEAQYEWNDLDGWQPTCKQALKLEIVQLEHSISGTSVPVPKTLLKYVLNMLLPALLEARILAGLPAEVGQYFIEKGTPGLQVGGKLRIAGLPLGPLNADLAAPDHPGASPLDIILLHGKLRCSKFGHTSLNCPSSSASLRKCGTRKGQFNNDLRHCAVSLETCVHT
jgi:hypothetical protein